MFQKVDRSFIFMTNDQNAVSVHSGAFGTMAESEFQRSLHRLDSHKSSACVCGVSVEVSKLDLLRLTYFGEGKFDVFQSFLHSSIHPFKEIVQGFFFFMWGCKGAAAAAALGRKLSNVLLK